jgi:hypothetical protein
MRGASLYDEIRRGAILRHCHIYFVSSSNLGGNYQCIAAMQGYLIK